jgi:hypothetical protein
MCVSQVGDAIARWCVACTARKVGHRAREAPPTELSLVQ